MLNGKELGDALREAMRRKGVTPTQVAEAFGIKSPSVYDWMKYGRIGKRHLNKLVSYFLDAVPPEHWGISVESGAWAHAVEVAGSETSSDLTTLLASALAELPESLRPTVGKLLESMASAPNDAALRASLTTILENSRKRA